MKPSLNNYSIIQSSRYWKKLHYICMDVFFDTRLTAGHKVASKWHVIPFLLINNMHNSLNNHKIDIKVNDLLNNSWQHENSIEIFNMTCKYLYLTSTLLRVIILAFTKSADHDQSAQSTHPCVWSWSTLFATQSVIFSNLPL